MSGERIKLIARFASRIPQLVNEARVTFSGQLPVRETETVVLPTPEQLEQLIAKEKEAWKNFLGYEIEVPAPPQELFAAWQRAEEQGLNIFEAHFLPPIEFKQDSDYPGWKVKPSQLYWDWIQKGMVAVDSAKLGPFWILVDSSPKPDYDDGQQMYPNDPLAKMIAELRLKGKIASPRGIPQDSRFGLSWEEIAKEVNPQIARDLGVSPDQVRLPNAIEFNVLDNLHYRQWGTTNTLEWLNDRFGNNGHLFGGNANSENVGFAYVHFASPNDHHNGRGFRPLVVFPAKS